MGTWIEINKYKVLLCTFHRRSLQWERGLKSLLNQYLQLLMWSFPAMGTWIEMSDIDKAIKDIDCRSLQWERGLKFFSYFHWVPAFRRSLQWERGLKYILGGCLVSS